MSNKSEKELSKYISLILRHKPEVIGIQLDEHGWADVPELIAGISKTIPIDMTLLEKIVAEDEKQRYSFNEDKTLIRANQGHSIPVDVELEEVVPPVLINIKPDSLSLCYPLKFSEKYQSDSLLFQRFLKTYTVQW